MPGVSQMNPDLMLPSRLQTDLQERCLRIALQHAHMRYGWLSSLWILRNVHTKRRVFGQARPYCEFVFLHSSFDERRVNSSGGVVLELVLQEIFGLNSFCEDQQARRFAVQTMDDKDLF